MVVRLAVAVVAQPLNDPAFRNPSVAASIDHAFKFPLQCLESFDLLVYFLDLNACDGVYRLARLTGLISQLEEVADRFEGEPQLTAMSDEYEPLDMETSITTLIT